MAIANKNKLRQYLVEFIIGTGIRTNGIADTAQGTTGPFVWRVPPDVSHLNIMMCAGGSGAAGGGAFTTGVISVGGGGGGPSGNILVTNTPAGVVPNTELKITVGKGGLGTAAGVDGYTQSSVNQPTNSYIEANGVNDSGIVGAVHESFKGRIANYSYGGGVKGSASTTTWANGGGSWGTTDSNGHGAGGSTAAGSGISGSISEYELYGGGCIMRHISVSGCGGAAGAATGSVAGGNNTFTYAAPGNPSATTASAASGLGNTTGTLSRGAGGKGGPTFFGRGGGGGAGGSPGSVGLGYGAGGGGGGGDAAGGNGTNGYVRFTYWSAS